jgi:hypothetical protein
VRPWLAPAAPAALATGPSPTFSVVIPAYQAAATVATAVESALAQTVSPLEVIVADDGSTDDLTEALRPYSSEVTLIQGAHRGVSATRNAAIARARGDFVVNLDADDVFLPERIEALAELGAKRPDLDILATEAWIERGGVREARYRELVRFPVDDQRLRVIAECPVLAPAARRTRLLEVGGYDERLRCAEDWELWARLVLTGSAIGLVDEPLYIYRRSGASLAEQTVVCLRDRVTMFESLQQLPGLAACEQSALAAAHRQRSREALLAEAEAALAERWPDVRRRALAVAAAPGVPLTTRAKAVISAAVPSIAGGALRRRNAAPKELESK